eukprot:UN02571
MLLSFLVLNIIVISFVNSDESSDDIDCGDFAINPNGITVVLLQGTKPNIEDQEVPNPEDPENPLDATCWELDILHMESEEIIGTAIDCGSTHNPTTELDGPGFTSIGTTTFDIGNGNTITSRGIVTIQPSDPDTTIGFTHITGSVPDDNANSILLGQGIFGNSEGTVRLSGAIAINPDTPGFLTFNCIFVLDLETECYKKNHYILHFILT